MFRIGPFAGWLDEILRIFLSTRLAKIGGGIYESFMVEYKCVRIYVFTEVPFSEMSLWSFK